MLRASLTNAAVAADVATINHMAEEYCEKLGAHFCVVADPDGHWLGRAGTVSGVGSGSALDAEIAAAEHGRSANAMLEMNGELFLVVSEPAMFASETVGTFTAGYRLDDAVAAELAVGTNSEVSFVCGGLCGSSLPAATRRELNDALAERPDALGSSDSVPVLRRIGGTPYVGGRYLTRRHGRPADRARAPEGLDDDGPDASRD